MKMAWIILFAMVAGADGQSSSLASDLARPVLDPTVQAIRPAPSRPRILSIARKSWHRAAGSGHWSWSGLEEFDTEEVDESWMLHLDADATVPTCWAGLSWSLPGSAPTGFFGVTPVVDSYFPLRC